MEKIRTGFAMCGSFCTFSAALKQMRELKEKGLQIKPIMSETAYSTDTRFGTAQSFIDEAEEICGEKIIHSIKAAEPIGPQKLLDILIIEPCTGNTLAKLANGITDTSVTMAAKAHIRNGRPLLLAISTNDALGAAAANIGRLMNYKNVYFVPMSQDEPASKPNSVVADFSKTYDATLAALQATQLQPVLLR